MEVERGGGSWELVCGRVSKMLFAMVVAFGCGSVFELLLVRVASCWGDGWRGNGGRGWGGSDRVTWEGGMGGA